MEKKNLFLVSGIMVVLVVAIFGIVMFSSGEKGVDINPNLNVVGGSDNIVQENPEMIIQEDVTNVASNSIAGGSSPDAPISFEVIPELNKLPSSFEENPEDNVESEEKIKPDGP